MHKTRGAPELPPRTANIAIRGRENARKLLVARLCCRKLFRGVGDANGSNKLSLPRHTHPFFVMLRVFATTWPPTAIWGMLRAVAHSAVATAQWSAICWVSCGVNVPISRILGTSAFLEISGALAGTAALDSKKLAAACLGSL